MFNFSCDVDTTNKLMQKIKNSLIKEEVISSDQLVSEKNLNSGNKQHVSVFVLVDVSGSITEYLDEINKAVHKFVEAVVAPNSLAREGIDFCYITFNETVNVRRPLGYLSSREKNADWINIKEEEVKGCTDIASALFTAWYMGEERKKYFKEKRIKYFQPFIILLSDLGHNRERRIPNMDENSLLDLMLELIRIKRENKKIGMIEITPCQPEAHSQEKIRINARKIHNLPVEHIDTSNPEKFVEAFNAVLRMCQSTVANPGKEHKLQLDEDDSIIKSTTMFFEPESDSEPPIKKRKERGKLFW